MKVVFVSLMLLLFLTTQGQAFSLEHPQKKGLAATFGTSYAPAPSFGFAQLSLMALYDYEQIFAHQAPDDLRFKFEGNIGLADDSDPRLLASVNIFALYYLEPLETNSFHPYVEAGIGLVYSDFQVEDQGLRINFNPQIGFGSEWRAQSGRSYYGAVRAWHLSNGGLHQDNQGINAVTLQLGVHF